MRLTLMPPEWEVTCIIVDGNGKLLPQSNTFVVDIHFDAKISKFKERSQSQNPRSLPYDPTSLLLWKPVKDVDASFSHDQLEEIIGGLSSNANNNDVERLLETRSVSKYWSTAPDSELLHVIVQAPHEVILGKKHRREEEDDTTILAKRLKTITDIAPSSLAQPPRFQKVVGEDQMITVNRPYEISSIPVALYERAIGVFRDRCKQLPSDKAMDCLLRLTQVGCEWYPVEADRREAVAKVFSECLDLQFHTEKIGITEYVTDGHLAFNIVPAAIRECKNEEGSALYQATLFYTIFLSRALLGFGNRNTCFPSILVVDSGSKLGFYAAIWDGQQVRIEPLCRGIDLTAFATRGGSYLGCAGGSNPSH
ncbi:hypothetical protein H2248_004290 [Termitomyces sp. 'cryptogamus']|nr:hypothetical protein H2248_004290 [Termitomyces sp. 'cryptogamus']